MIIIVYCGETVHAGDRSLRLNSLIDQVNIKESHLCLAPRVHWISLRTARRICLLRFMEEALVRFPIGVPVLHSVGNVCRLHHMIQHNCGFKLVGFCYNAILGQLCTMNTVALLERCVDG
jgi:hypothetical protein